MSHHRFIMPRHRWRRGIEANLRRRRWRSGRLDANRVPSEGAELKRSSWLFAVALVMVGTASCSNERELAAPEPSAAFGATTVALASEAPVAESVALATQPTPIPEQTPPPTVAPQPDTIPQLTSTIEGTAGSGSSGGIGEDQTNSFSESVRNADGTCSGWSNDLVPAPWTNGLVAGAPFVILAAQDDTVLGQGNMGTSSYRDVGTDGQQQWLCEFPFSATIQGAKPAKFRIKVADLEPWVVSKDGNSERYIASVNTQADPSLIEQCANPDASEVTPWNVVGTYWSNGVQDLCFSGVSPTIKRICRGPNQGSEYITKVTQADAENVVYEDASGLLVDVSTFAVGTPVWVFVATARPC